MDQAVQLAAIADKTKWHRTRGWDDGYRLHYEQGPWRRLIPWSDHLHHYTDGIGYEYATDEEMARIALKEKFDH